MVEMVDRKGVECGSKLSILRSNLHHRRDVMSDLSLLLPQITGYGTAEDGLLAIADEYERK